MYSFQSFPADVSCFESKQFGVRTLDNIVVQCHAARRPLAAGMLREAEGKEVPISGHQLP